MRLWPRSRAAVGGTRAKLSAQVAGLESTSALMRGDVRRALSAGEEALPRIRRYSPKQSTAGFLTGLPDMNCFAGRYGRAARLVHESREFCDLYELDKHKAELEVVRGTLLAQGGHLDECLWVFDRALAAPLLQSHPLQVELHSRRGTVLRRSGSLGMAAHAYEQALRTTGSTGAAYDKLNGQLDLAFTEGLLGSNGDAAQRIRRLIDEAGELQLLFHQAKGGFFLGVLSVHQDGKAIPALGPPCSELLRLGHVDFLGQELVAHPEAARSLLSADVAHDTLKELLEAIAPQVGGPSLLATLAALSDRAGALVMETARGHLPARQARQLLTALRRHPSQPVHDRAGQRSGAGGDA